MTTNVRSQDRSPAARVADSGELLLVSALAALLSLLAFLFFYGHGDILLCGDAVAHLNIARRLFDSPRPGSDQLGSVWLPLPHLLIAPFVANDWLWRTGVGGSIPSMAAYIVGVAGVFRLVRARASRAGAWLAAVIYGLNPSLLYMQSTAMTESVFLAALVWSVAYFDDFLRGLHDGDAIGASRALERCGLCLAAAVFTRYDGWIVAFVMAVCIMARVVFIRRKGGPDVVDQVARHHLLRSTISFLLLLAMCPALWLAHNYKINRRPLDWLNGPYSAKAIDRRSVEAGIPPYPGKGHPIVAAEHFLKAARMNTGEGVAENWLFSLACAGVLIATPRPRRFGALLLLWLPLPFYTYSIAYGSVPVYVPEWWPFSYYNVRYGLELLPAIAVFAGLLPWAVARLLARYVISHRYRRLVATAANVVLLVVALVAANFSAGCFSRRSQRGPRQTRSWFTGVKDHPWPRQWMIPVCYREAWVNSRDRLALESQLAEVLATIPPNSTVLMYTSDHVGALQMASIHFRRVISESAYFRWDAALSAPFAAADTIVAIDGDPVAEAVRRNPRGITKIAILHTMHQPDVTVYRSSRPQFSEPPTSHARRHRAHKRGRKGAPAVKILWGMATPSSGSASNHGFPIFTFPSLTSITQFFNHTMEVFMRFLVKVSIPTETGNARVLDGSIATTIESILNDIKPEAAYWAEEQGERTGFIFCNIKEESDIPMIAEPFFLGLGARVEFHPCMTLADLKKAAPGFENAVRKYSPMKQAA